MRTVCAMFRGLLKNAGSADVPECASAFCFPGAAWRSVGELAYSEPRGCGEVRQPTDKHAYAISMCDGECVRDSSPCTCEDSPEIGEIGAFEDGGICTAHMVVSDLRTSSTQGSHSRSRTLQHALQLEPQHTRGMSVRGN